MSSKALLDLFISTRKKTESICSFLEIEDYVVQPIVDVSPPKWHLGHTTWFFEEFILKHSQHYKKFHQNFSLIFNSYYESIGEKVARDKRGNLSRPTVVQIYDYRAHVDRAMISFLETKIPEDLEQTLLIGIHHEKQHQELLMSDIKYILGTNPLRPKYNEGFEENPEETTEEGFIDIPEGIYEIGHENEDEFCYDNELGVHRVFLQDFSISKKLVTNAEYLEFIESGGYRDVLLWHAEGWEWKNENEIKAPLYWHQKEGEWFQYTLKGFQKLKMNAAVSHVSFYEAAAFSKWKKMRLPTEFEWEAAQQHLNSGSRWEWTESAYLPYPNYKIAEGAIGEYNGKFMINQMVLRGGSVATPAHHLRPTYRNFYPPQFRLAFFGIRLVK